jgi:hypothetical protein
MRVCLYITACYGSDTSQRLPPNEHHKYFIGRKLCFELVS